VKDKATKEPFEKSGAANTATKECIERGLFIYPGSGQVDGLLGDNFIVAPPLIINEEQVAELLEKLTAGLDAAAKKLL
jgi:adenosylmethionine-8-amino-7-oxononanoate aminotransferase